MTNFFTAARTVLRRDDDVPTSDTVRNIGSRMAFELSAIRGERRVPVMLLKNAIEAITTTSRQAAPRIARLSAIYWIMFDDSTEPLCSFGWCAAAMDLDKRDLRRRLRGWLAGHGITYTEQACREAYDLEHRHLWPLERLRVCLEPQCKAPRAPRCGRCGAHCKRHDHTRATGMFPTICFEDGCSERRHSNYNRCATHQRQLWKRRMDKFRETRRQRKVEQAA